MNWLCVEMRFLFNKYHGSSAEERYTAERVRGGDLCEGGSNSTAPDACLRPSQRRWRLLPVRLHRCDGGGGRTQACRSYPCQATEVRCCFHRRLCVWPCQQ